MSLGADRARPNRIDSSSNTILRVYPERESVEQYRNRLEYIEHLEIYISSVKSFLPRGGEYKQMRKFGLLEGLVGLLIKFYAFRLTEITVSANGFTTKTIKHERKPNMLLFGSA